MLNFREELTKIKEGRRKVRTVEEYSEVFLISLLDILNRNNYKELIFELNNEIINVKTSTNNVTNLYSSINKCSSEIFYFIKKKFQSEKFEIKENNNNIFIVCLD